jgi:hypothetical protein
MNCKKFEESLALYVYGELPGEEQAAWDAHLVTCAPCRAGLEEARRLQRLLSQRPAAEPTPQLLAQCRQALGEALDREPSPAGWTALLEEWLSFLPPSPAFRAAGALSVLVFGFGLGWMLRPRVAATRAVSPGNVSTATLAPDFDNNMRFGGISRVVPDPQTGDVHITLEASRHVTLEGSLDDPRIQQVLLYAVKSYDNPGIRRETLDALRPRGNNPNVRQALLYAMGHDPNLGVRLEALDAVRGLDWGADARQAFLEVLERDTNPGLRAAAVDELARHADADSLAVLASLAANDSNRYVRLKCASAVRELGAQ